MQLYNFQKQSVAQLLSGKHIIISGTGCLAGDTPIPLADGGWKRVDELSSDDTILSYDECKQKFVRGKVDCVFRTCHKPKPMIQLEYDGEQITTTYDHPFFNGEGYYPLYQLIWGALETSQRVQLKLLCKQYGQSFDDKAIRCKHCGSNETCIGRQWLLQDNDGRENCKNTQNCSRELVEEPYQLGMCEPFELRQGRQQSGKPRVVFKKIQCLVWSEVGKYQASRKYEQQKINKGTKRICKRRIFEVLKRDGKKVVGKHGESEVLRQNVQGISERLKGNNTGMGLWKIKVKVSEPYYSICMREAPYTYCIGRKHYFITHNTGKTAMGANWIAKQVARTGKRKVLIVTTASKSRTSDWEDEVRKWHPSLLSSLSSLSTLSWHKLRTWVDANWRSLGEWVVVFDEIQKASAGVSSGMGKAFLKITKHTKDWAGFTATPGDTWLKFYPYMVATGLEWNKTSFMRKYANVQTYKGYPEIVGWRNEDELRNKWASISYAPDTSKVMAELPPETHKIVEFKKPSAYNKVMKTRTSMDGEFLDTSGALCAELRRLCFTKEKREWVKEFIEGLGDGAVVFYNFIKTGDELEEIITKALPKGARVWRIDGKHHEIPTAETIGKYDIVLCQWQSGSEALNLQMLHYWVSVEACYSYSTSVQARGRIKRIGQQNSMFYYYLKTPGTIEDAIYDALRNKSEFSERNWTIENNLIEGEEYE